MFSDGCDCAVDNDRSHERESFSREGIVLTKTNRSVGEVLGCMFVK